VGRGVLVDVGIADGSVVVGGAVAVGVREAIGVAVSSRVAVVVGVASTVDWVTAVSCIEAGGTLLGFISPWAVQAASRINHKRNRPRVKRCLRLYVGERVILFIV
jgi:hypothetical protein